VEGQRWTMTLRETGLGWVDFFVIFTGGRILIRFKTMVHEDNQGTLRLAQMEPGRSTPRLMFYAAIKHHWFRFWLKSREIELVYIDTKEQKADFLTKSLSSVDFEINWKLSCGWLPCVREGDLRKKPRSIQRYWNSAKLDSQP
jgi:hypothetical protein